MKPTVLVATAMFQTFQEEGLQPTRLVATYPQILVEFATRENAERAMTGLLEADAQEEIESGEPAAILDASIKETGGCYLLVISVDTGARQ